MYGAIHSYHIIPKWHLNEERIFYKQISPRSFTEFSVRALKANLTETNSWRFNSWRSHRMYRTSELHAGKQFLL